MQGLSREEGVQVAEVERSLALVDLDGPPLLSTFLPQLQDVLGSTKALAYSVRCRGEQAALDSWGVAGVDAARAAVQREAMGRWVQEGGVLCGLYDPRRPEPAQRNRPIHIDPLRRIAEQGAEHPLLLLGVDEEAAGARHASVEALVSHLRGDDAANDHQLRALVCEGPVQLAWVGAFQPEPFDQRATRLFRAILPALQRRLAIEARLGQHDRHPLLGAVLDELGAPAYVLDGRDRIVGCNAAAEQALARDRARVLEQLRAARRAGGNSAFVVVDLAARGVPHHALLLARLASDDAPDAALALARERFGLTARETEVLAHVVQGRTNHAISVLLGCSERTVETHMSRLLAKTDAPSRASLAALVWAGARG